MKDEELKKEDEALKAEQAGGKDQASETGEAKETEASNDIPETQEGTPDETEETVWLCPPGENSYTVPSSGGRTMPGGEAVRRLPAPGHGL